MEKMHWYSIGTQWYLLICIQEKKISWELIV